MHSIVLALFLCKLHLLALSCTV